MPKPKLNEEQFRRIPEFRKSLETFLDSPAGEAVQEILRSFSEPSGELVGLSGSVEGAYFVSSGRLSLLKKLQSLTIMPADEKKQASLKEILDKEMPALPETFTTNTKPE